MKNVWTVAFLAGAVAFAQESAPERVNVPLTDPSRPVVVKASLLNGSIHVRAYQGKEVVVEARGKGARQRRAAEPPPGMRRIDVTGLGLNIDEQDNTVRINAGPHMNIVELEIQVPRQASVNLKTVNNGNVIVEGIEGEIDVQALNGDVTLTDVSGAVVAHSLNGEVKVNIQRMAAKPMSFSTLNGDIDVTFPADLKANVKMKSQNGDIFTDYDVAATQSSAAAPERSEGRYRIRFDRAFYGSINGGGPEIQFTTLNGKIYVRKAK